MKFCIAVKPCFFEVPYGKSAYAGLLGVDVYDLHRGSPSLAPSLSVRVVVTGDGKEKSYRIGSGVADCLCGLLDHIEKAESGMTIVLPKKYR